MLKNWKKRSLQTREDHIDDAKTDYTSGDLDSEAEIITAINVANTSLNAVLTALENVGALKTS